MIWLKKDFFFVNQNKQTPWSHRGLLFEPKAFGLCFWLQEFQGMVHMTSMTLGWPGLSVFLMALVVPGVFFSNGAFFVVL